MAPKPTRPTSAARRPWPRATARLILDRDEPVDMPPILIVQGAADDIVTPEMQEEFMASYRRRGGTAWMKTFDGMGHTFIPRHPAAAASVEAIDHIAAFIK